MLAVLWTALFCLLHVVVGGTDDHPNLSVVGPVSKVVGGTQQPIEEFPFLGTLQSYKHFCGASIIDEEWILTAAHCMEGEKIENLFIAVGTNGSDRSHTSQAQKGYISEVFVNPGYVETNDEILLHDLALLKQTFAFEEKHTHPDYIDEDGFPQDDVALIKLAKPIQYGLRVQPLVLTRKLEIANDTNIVILGWGLTKAGGPFTSESLLGFTGKFVPSCSSSSKLCFDGGNKARGTCDGDSGSPLVYCNRRINKFVQASLQLIELESLHGLVTPDIGLIKLRHPIKLGKRVQKILLKRNLKVKNGTDIHIMGWGYGAPLNAKGDHQLHGYVANFLYKCNAWICFRHELSAVCPGDSGGPMAVHVPQLDAYVQHSLVHGVGPGKCGSVGQFTSGPELANYCDWIDKTVGKKICI
ncbi:unnamed protein product, partial [Mesorhabditis spiculigera]